MHMAPPRPSLDFAGGVQSRCLAQGRAVALPARTAFSTAGEGALPPPQAPGGCSPRTSRRHSHCASPCMLVALQTYTPPSKGQGFLISRVSTPCLLNIRKRASSPRSNPFFSQEILGCKSAGGRPFQLEKDPAGSQRLLCVASGPRLGTVSVPGPVEKGKKVLYQN